MADQPICDRTVPLSFGQHVIQRNIAEWDDPDRGSVNHRHPLSIRIDDRTPVPDNGQRFVADLVFVEKGSCSSLAASQDRTDQAIAKWPGEGEFNDGELFMHTNS
ncbi:hypothetical protein NtRootA4_29210 [Arthrobacter sp. NtRootA4]|nr:hypothetical protein NtRootA2_31400 [Arthrobacter sp. NtRootA2]BCW15942.1 hypothetical protein NtRootA4_29210 [Arthrobacter sp. NtRootA4]BCW24275.1 hypothetical protein NtRootC7_31420 [Arthrobacter sp. NtRootC7]BCW32814.1 hypothetical protein NtRootD5_31450 [Arthrobacter sp. NtRootD5]